MKKIFNKIVAMMMAVLMVALLLPAMTVKADETYTDIPIDVYTLIESNTVCGDVNLTITVEAGDAVVATDTTPEIKAGVSGFIKVGGIYNASTAVTLNQSTKYDSVQGTDTVVLPSGYSYTKNQICVSIKTSDITEPGIYRYKVTISCADNTYIVDSNNPKYIDLYVVNANPSGVEVAGNVIHNGTDVPGINGSKPSGTPSDSEGETDVNNNITSVTGGNDSFVIAYKLKLRDVSFNHVTQGNMSDADETFKYTIKAEDNNNPYDIKQPSVTGVSGATISGDATTQTIVLDGIVKNGTAFTVKDITSTSTVTITIQKGDYKMEYTIDGGSATASDDGVISFTAGNNNRAVVVTLTKNNVLPTGINIVYMPYIMLLIIILAAMGFSTYKIFRRKHSK